MRRIDKEKQHLQSLKKEYTAIRKRKREIAAELGWPRPVEIVDDVPGLFLAEDQTDFINWTSI